MYNTLSEDAANHDWVQEPVQPHGCMFQPGKNESLKAREAEHAVDGNRQTRPNKDETSNRPNLDRN